MECGDVGCGLAIDELNHKLIKAGLGGAYALIEASTNLC